ncbi:hypothetical protein PC113_g25583 [Phytophthora cactorum]|uniref:Retroviral polymerase SH3-like domain-containing protein n=1 Tax=Phytophthora cactorum TaxID=29920 RepID=A0A8T0Y6V1_9STRA|nr:hypothetical protein PC113_g25583 [Phytophthora cactorum]
MRVFGCRTYILTPKEKRLKWDPKARAGLFLGYEEVSKAYRLYDIEAGQVVISRDVNFDESTFGLSPRISDEDVDDLDVDSLDIDDDGPRQTEYKQTGKRKSRPSDEDEATRRPHTTQTKKKSMEMKMTIRLHQFFGVQVPMPSKQAIYRSRRHSKKR